MCTEHINRLWWVTQTAITLDWKNNCEKSNEFRYRLITCFRVCKANWYIPISGALFLADNVHFQGIFGINYWIVLLPFVPEIHIYISLHTPTRAICATSERAAMLYYIYIKFMVFCVGKVLFGISQCKWRYSVWVRMIHVSWANIPSTTIYPKDIFLRSVFICHRHRTKHIKYCKILHQTTFRDHETCKCTHTVFNRITHWNIYRSFSALGYDVCCIAVLYERMIEYHSKGRVTRARYHMRRSLAPSSHHNLHTVRSQIK